MKIEKPLVTVSGKKILFKSDLNRRIVQDLPNEGLEWRRRLDSITKFVYIDVDFVDFDIDDVERSSERSAGLVLEPIDGKSLSSQKSDDQDQPNNSTSESVPVNLDDELIVTIETNQNESLKSNVILKAQMQQHDISHAFFNKKLLGRPILHTYWADKTDFEDENQKGQFDEWIGKVQASNCTEWAIIIIEDGDFKAQLGTAIFKSKLQSTNSQSNTSTTSTSSTSHSSISSSFLDRVKKGLSTMFQSDSNSDRWLTLVSQDRQLDSKAQESYDNFLRKLRNIIMASFSKQIELFEEQLRVRREMRNDKSWNFFTYFSMQEELAFAFEFITLFDEALVQYDLLDALFSEYISSPSFNKEEDPLYDQWTSFNSWPGLCLDMTNSHSEEMRKRIVESKASLLELRNYLFAKKCDLMLLQNQPWRVSASANIFLQNCVREHEFLGIKTLPGALTCWSFVSAIEVLQKCECYNCTSTMENYSLHTVDIWNCARRKLLELGLLTNQTPGLKFTLDNARHIEQLLEGLGPDPHGGVSYQNEETSPQTRLRDALAGHNQFAKHLIDISELTLGTYKHIGRSRHALLLGKEIADFYIAQGNPSRALPFLTDFEKSLETERWPLLMQDIKLLISKCKKMLGDTCLSVETEVRNGTSDITVKI